MPKYAIISWVSNYPKCAKVIATIEDEDEARIFDSYDDAVKWAEKNLNLQLIYWSYTIVELAMKRR
jgi:hypothetical protein